MKKIHTTLDRSTFLILIVAYASFATVYFFYMANSYILPSIKANTANDVATERKRRIAEEEQEIRYKFSREILIDTKHASRRTFQR